MNFPVLSAITFVPLLISVIVLIIPKSKENLIRWVSTILSLIPLALAIYVYFVVQADPGTMQFKEEYSWIPAIDAFYRMGVDGLSAMMLVLTALLSTLCLYYSIYTIKDRVKEYYFLFLLLQVGMTGVFVSLDFVFFYVFWEIGLVPMYLLIGVWGGKRRIYASIKFFLYTLAGSMAMLLAIIAVYLNTGTFNILEAAAASPLPGTSHWLQWHSGLSLSVLPSKCLSSPSTPGFRMPTQKHPLLVVSSLPAFCLSWAPTV